jgi:dipeptidase
MSNITEEEGRELIIEYIRYVFEEVKTEGWKTRRNEFLIQRDRYVEEEADTTLDDMTFDKAMEKYGDMDEVISLFLYPILENPQWVEAWIHQLRPDLDQRHRGFCYYWSGWTRLNNFLYKRPDVLVPGQMFYVREINYDDVKEVLGFGFYLK